jgi:hypothetical protein
MLSNHEHTTNVQLFHVMVAGLILARAASSSGPALPPNLQHLAIQALLQQLRHHSGPAAAGGGSSNGNTAGSVAGRNLTLAGAAALALGFLSLTGQVDLPELLADSSSGEDAAASASANGGSSSSSSSVPPGSVLGVLLSLAANGKDSRAALRAVAAVGYIAAGSTDPQVHLAAAKGELVFVWAWFA